MGWLALNPPTRSFALGRAPLRRRLRHRGRMFDDAVTVGPLAEAGGSLGRRRARLGTRDSAGRMFRNADRGKPL